ncbi:MAG TPA: 2-dehydropantoate 2-reductase [Ramlibacter sp.]|nr:2-dehydropantoate 2-reductase [Ramlibacter sp.]
MDICIFGAGAIGGLIAARLAQVSQVRVTVIARGLQLDAIRRSGLRIADDSTTRTVHVHATDDARSVGVQDYVFVTVKTQQFTPSLPDIAPLVGPGTVVIPPTTAIPYWYFHGIGGPHEGRRVESIDPGNRQWNAIPPSQVLGCVFRVAGQVVEPGVVRQDGGYARLPLGEPDGKRSDRAMRLSHVMTLAGFESPVVPNIRGWIWHKAISSLCWNPLAALTGATWGQLASDPRVLALARRMIDEADAVAASLKGAPPIPIEERMAAALSAPHHRMSMLQDLEAGRPLEYEPLLASFHALRGIAGLTTPAIDDVYALLQLRAAAATRTPFQPPYGDIDGPHT